MSNINITRDPYKGRSGVSASMNATSTNLRTFLVERMKYYSIVADIAETSASLAGTIKLQASNNAYLDNVNMDLNPAAVWVDVPSSSVVLTAGSTQTMWNVADVGYEAVRVNWTRTSGQGTMTFYFMAKG
jgi:hypothetical protein